MLVVVNGPTVVVINIIQLYNLPIWWSLAKNFSANLKSHYCNVLAAFNFALISN